MQRQTMALSASAACLFARQHDDRWIEIKFLFEVAGDTAGAESVVRTKMASLANFDDET
jgi:hypothetical protein